ncbi:hypothetical protein DL769_004658 [Monosporascus sp. CRB-8-3]|nr:hypothetical protein DL769_004658 [Monosporascus sp. CRB-8-3]
MGGPVIVRNPGISDDDVALCDFVRRFVSLNQADSFPRHLSFLPSLLGHHDHELWARSPDTTDGQYGAVGGRTARSNRIPVLKQGIHSIIDDMRWCGPFALGDVDSDGRPAAMPHNGAAE